MAVCLECGDEDKWPLMATVDIDERDVIETAKLIGADVLAYLDTRGGHAPATDLLHQLTAHHGLPEIMARAVLWFLMEECELQLGRGMELEKVKP